MPFFSSQKKQSSSASQQHAATQSSSTTTTSATTTAPPPSPFFRPSLPDRVVVQHTVSTPLGRHKRTLQVSATPGAVAEHKSGLLGCAANMCTCIVGSGIVGLPFAIQQTGFCAGVLLVLLTAALTEKSLRLLVETAKHLHKQSYETAAEVPFGVAGFRFILINMFVMAYGAMVTYLMITKSCAALLIGVEGEEQKEQIVLLILSLVVQLPLACMRDMADLEKTSGLAVAIDCAIVVLVATASPWIGMKGVNENSFWEVLQHDTIRMDTLFVGLGVLSFAFECQEAAFLVAGSLEKPTVARWSKVTKMTLSACVVLSMACAVTGYLGYGAATKGNILTNLPVGMTAFVAHGMLGITMFATYPLASFVARHVCIVLLFEGPRAREGGDDSTILKRADRRIVLTAALYLAALIPATVYTNMGKVLALAGVIGGSCLAYIGPGMLYLAVHGGRFLVLVDEFFLVPKDSLPAATDERVVDSETTALLHGRNTTTSTETTEERRIDGCFKTFLWYIGCMPLWCKVAKVGKQRILDHAATLAKSNVVEALRIGDVDHSAIEKLIASRQSPKDSETGLGKFGIRALSDHKSGVSTLIAPMKSTPQNLPPIPRLQSAPSRLEADPQENPPAWIDFFIAIFYVCFGILALFAGLISLSVSTD